MKIEASESTCGATVHDIDLRTIDDDGVAALRACWLEHKVIGIAGQHLSIGDLEHFAARWGPFGDDPFIAPIDNHPHVIEVKREADEKAPVFASNWHSDWSFLATPPAATLLYGVEVPPVGGDTLFADLDAALHALPPARQTELAAIKTIHSAKRSYAPDGRYGDRDKGRSMRIRANTSALATQEHPLVKTHSETGRESLFLSPAYTVGIKGMADAPAQALLKSLFTHAGSEQFVYRHKWTPGMLTIWDNRCLNHMATGGYEGHRRLLYRMTIGEPQPH